MNKIKGYFTSNARVLISWSLFIIWMIVIFILSAQNAEKSSDTSGSVLTFILNITYRGFKDMNPSEQFELLEIYQGVIRKFAHFFIFGILGVLAVNAYKSLKIRDNGKVAILAFATCVIYAITDEVHQLFVPGRAFEFTDIIIDSSGSFIFISLSLLIVYLIENRKEAQSDMP